MLKSKINQYLNSLMEAKSPTSLQEKIVDFFKKNPKPSDKQIHAFAERVNMNHHKFEEVVYELFGSFVAEGYSKNYNGSYDSKELAMGIKVEMEHTTNPLLAKKIAYDHLSEIPDYYTRLEAMEEQAKKEGVMG